jgi:hypothetical protein
MRPQICLLALLLLAGCGSPRISTFRERIDHPVSLIATSPSGGDAADAIVHGFDSAREAEVRVLDTKSTRELLQELGIPEIKAAAAVNLDRLKNERGVDALLRVETTSHHAGRMPRSIRVLLVSTHDPRQNVDLTWNNTLAGTTSTIDQVGAEIARQVSLSIAGPPNR